MLYCNDNKLDTCCGTKVWKYLGRWNAT